MRLTLLASIDPGLFTESEGRESAGMLGLQISLIETARSDVEMRWVSLSVMPSSARFFGSYFARSSLAAVLCATTCGARLTENDRITDLQALSCMHVNNNHTSNTINDGKLNADNLLFEAWLCTYDVHTMKVDWSYTQNVNNSFWDNNSCFAEDTMTRCECVYIVAYFVQFKIISEHQHFIFPEKIVEIFFANHNLEAFIQYPQNLAHYGSAIWSTTASWKLLYGHMNQNLRACRGCCTSLIACESSLRCRAPLPSPHKPQTLCSSLTYKIPWTQNNDFWLLNEQTHFGSEWAKLSTNVLTQIDYPVGMSDAALFVQSYTEMYHFYFLFYICVILKECSETRHSMRGSCK